MSLIEKIKNIGEKKTIIIYGDSLFSIEFNEKQFVSQRVSEVFELYLVILDIPYNAKIYVEATDSDSARISIREYGTAPEDLPNGNNPIINIKKLIGEPQE